MDTLINKTIKLAVAVAGSLAAASSAFSQDSFSDSIDAMRNVAAEEVGRPVDEASMSSLTKDEEIERLEGLPARSWPILDEELGQAITTIALQADMEILAPRREDFGDTVSLNITMNPYKVLKMLSTYYGFEMSYESGVWMFVREAPHTLVARTYELVHTDLSQYDVGQNTTTSKEGGGSTGGRIMENDATKLVEDVKELLGVASSKRDIVVMNSGEALPMSLLGDLVNFGGEQDSPKSKSKEKEAANGARIITLPDTNSLLVYASLAQHQIVEAYLKEADREVARIKIDVIFVRTKRSHGEIFGVDWSDAQPGFGVGNLNTVIDLNGDFSNDSPWPSQAQFSADDMSLQLNFIHNDDDSEVWNEASVTTSNNREVHFSVGTQEPFEQASLQTGLGAGLGGSESTIEFKHIGIAMNITPKVFKSDKGTSMIRCIVKLTNTDLRGFRRINGSDVPVVGGQENVFEVMIRDGYTQPFVGFKSFTDTFVQSGVPGLKKIPIIGGLFRSKDKGKAMENIIGYVHVQLVEGDGQPRKPTREELREANQVSGFGS